MQKCSAFAKRVQPALDKLYTDMGTCAKAKTGKTHQKVRSQLENTFLSKTKRKTQFLSSVKMCSMLFLDCALQFERLK